MAITAQETIDGLRETLRNRGINYMEEHIKGTLLVEAGGPGEVIIRIWDTNTLGILPTEAELLQAAGDRAARLQAEAAEEARLAQVIDDARTAAEAIPGWATWTLAEVNQWIDDNLATELAAQPKTLTAIRAMAKMLVAMRNTIWADMEGSA